MTNSTESKTESGKAILSQEQYQKSLYELNHLICVTKKNYQLLYLDLLANIAEWLQALPSLTESNYQNPYGLFTLSFMRAIVVLKHRRAYMLPPGANAETCYQQQDMWTYALFTAALLQDCWQKSNNIAAQDNFELAKQFIPEVGWQWLQRFKDLYTDWHEFLHHNTKLNNVIAAVIQKAEAALLNKPIATGQQPFASMLYPTTQLVVSSEQEIEKPTGAEKIISTTQKSHITSNVESTSKPAELTLAEQFISWLKQTLSDGKFNVNEVHEGEYGYIHIVANGVLLIITDLWDQFLLTHPLVSDDWQQLTRHNSYFIKTPSKTFIHVYSIGDWKHRQIIKGLMLEPSQLFMPDKLPPINQQLVSDLMGTV